MGRVVLQSSSFFPPSCHTFIIPPPSVRPSFCRLTDRSPFLDKPQWLCATAAFSHAPCPSLLRIKPRGFAQQQLFPTFSLSFPLASFSFPLRSLLLSFP